MNTEDTEKSSKEIEKTENVKSGATEKEKAQEKSEYGGGEIPDKNDSSKEPEKGAKSESSNNDTKSAELGDNYRYDGDTLVYTDPESKTEYVLSADGQEWVPRQDINYSFDGETYIHTDNEGNKLKWDLEKKEWVKINSEKKVPPKKDDENIVEEDTESEEDDNTTDEDRKKRQYRKRKAAPGWAEGEHFTDPDTGVQYYKNNQDGMTYEWDKVKNAWFPKIDEDFMAQYQMNYGFTKDGVAQPTLPEEAKEEEPKEKAKKTDDKSKKEVKQAKWFEEDEAKSTKVYVTNLPSNFNEEKFIEFMTKCGMIELDVRSNKPKVKLYKDENGQFKGDGLCTYIKVESVQLALQILDGSNVEGNVISVERAKFQMKGEKYDPKLKPKKLKKDELKKLQKHRDKMLAWVPEKLRGQRSKRDKIIVIKNLFVPQDFDKDASQILTLSANVRKHCSKFGSVRRVVVYDKHAEGVCQVFFSNADEADMAIEMMNGRMFHNKRIMKVETWDGKTKYKIDETEEEERERLAKWDKFLEEGGGEEEEGESGKQEAVKDQS